MALSAQACLHDALNSLTKNINDADALDFLDATAMNLARSEVLRQEIGGAEPPIWPLLETVWKKLNDLDMSRGDPELSRNGLMSVARVTRNLVAGVSSNQSKAMVNEPYIRRILHFYTAFSISQDPTTQPVTRMLIQTISNLVTENEPLMDCIWSTYMNLPEEQNVLVRMVALSDERAVRSAFVFILNCLSHGRSRMLLLLQSKSGFRVCVTILDKMVALIECEDSSEGGKAFETAYRIFEHLLENNLGPSFLQNLTLEGEVITPYQVTFLKVLDSYLLQSKSRALQRIDMLTLIVPLFFELSAYAQEAIRRSLEYSPEHPVSGGDKAPLQELDLMLPKVCEAIVLVTQCFCTTTLAEEDIPGTPITVSPKTVLVGAVSPQNLGLVESLIGLLRALNAFLPRIALGKVVSPNGRTGAGTPGPRVNVAGFNYLKRDLVRLLGIIGFGDKAVQDRVRACDGIPVVMNLCVVDDQNPFLREHALFTLRNLLHGNPENQVVVDEIKPMGTWDENGVLRDTPGVRK